MSDAAATRLVVRGRELDLSRPLLMGIVNATPDSFSDGGEHPSTDARAARAIELADLGADIVDIGGESAITGVPALDADEETERVVPVIQAVAAQRPGVMISVDTYKPAVAEAALAAGAALVNDVSGLLYPEIAKLCADAGAGLVIMHTRAKPKERVVNPQLYEDVMDDVVGFLEGRIAEAESRGLPRQAIVVDPGPDFAKTPHQTLQVLRDLDRVRRLGHPLLLALSRKDFIGAITRTRPKRRLAGTLAAVGRLAGPGTILRVHDVAAVADYLAVADALEGRLDIPADTELPMSLRREPR